MANGFVCGQVDAEEFQKSIFELTDLWTETVNLQEYLDFLDWLFPKMLEK